MALQVRIHPAGAAAERATAALCAGSALSRDPDAELGAPAAHAVVSDGEAALSALVAGAALALDEVDVALTVHRA